MKWEKKGLIYCPNESSSLPWRTSFAMLPTALKTKEDTLRIFLGFCNQKNVGSIGYVDVQLDNPSIIKEVSSSPILTSGRKGCFDDNGVVPVSVLTKNNQIFLYYIGFQLGVNVPYYMFCGLAISDDDNRKFYRYSETPILDRKNEEVFARCGCNVIFHDGMYKMWYIGSHEEGWVISQGKPKPLYVLKYTESVDGINWNGASIQCLHFQNEDEHGFGRPYVWFDKKRNLFRMLYSVRTYSRGYYIGYAESLDGISWIRRDKEAGIALSSSGWDSENMSYPFLFKTETKTYMFYNGNGCGRTGFGYAELIED